jgi:hypothetical protein
MYWKYFNKPQLPEEAVCFYNLLTFLDNTFQNLKWILLYEQPDFTDLWFKYFSMELHYGDEK